MDATTAPHRIPPEMPQYGEENHIFEMMQCMLEQLLIHRPRDPIPFLISHLQRDNDSVPRIAILGPPASGKTTIAMWLCKHLSCSLLSMESLVVKQLPSLPASARMCYQKTKRVPDLMLVSLLRRRLAQEDCVRRGWVLDGIPASREQTLMVQTFGIAPRHVIVLSAPDTVLIERNLGKRVDPQTGEIYHTTFDWPPDAEVQSRLVTPEGISELETAQRLLEFHRNIVRIVPSYPRVLKAISADQPCVDVFCQALTFVQSDHRSNAPFTPRVLLCGPAGSGKSLQAALLAQKYGLVDVCCGQLLKEAVADRSKLGQLVQDHLEKGLTVPDSVVMKVLGQRLGQQDCVQRGWVMHGFPRDLDQAHILASMGHKPNRVFFLNVPLDSIMERLTLRRTDPVTGERYHLLYKPPPTPLVQGRLQRNPRDDEERVRRRVDAYYRRGAGLEAFYREAVALNGDQDPYTVFEYIESGVINPLPKRGPRRAASPPGPRASAGQ